MNDEIIYKVFDECLVEPDFHDSEILIISAISFTKPDVVELKIQSEDLKSQWLLQFHQVKFQSIRFNGFQNIVFEIEIKEGQSFINELKSKPSKYGLENEHERLIFEKEVVDRKLKQFEFHPSNGAYILFIAEELKIYTLN
jgi:hypothetical protein